MRKSHNLIYLKKDFKLDEQIFNLGILLLPSAVVFSIILLLISLLFSFTKNYKLFFQEKSNFILVICAFLMIISCVKNTFFIDHNTHQILFGQNENYKDLIWLDLFNWIPLFFCFWGFQPYLKTFTQRYNSSINLLIGTIPVVVSCIGQYFFKWYGPISGFNGLIVWYQKPLIEGNGISGLFSNQNYTGFWLSVAWAFSLGLIYLQSTNLCKRIFSILASSSLFYFIILTNSRNALISSIIPVPLIFGFKIFFLGILIILILVFFIFCLFQLTPLEISSIKNTNVSPNIFWQLFEKLFRFDFNNFIQYERIDIWIKSLLAILEKPIFGWGAATFFYIYILKDPVSKATHTHNLSIQLAYNYGLPVSIILTAFVLNLISKNSKKLFLNIKKTRASITDRTWLSATLIGVFSQSFDITYFDGKVSILIWILLAGTKCISENES